MDRPNDLAVIGLGVMGRNLALNAADHGFRVAVYNRTPARTEEFLAGEAAPFPVTGFTTLPDLVGSLRVPRIVLLMVQAGPAVDAVIEELAPLLDPGDVIIDGGNSRFTDSDRRAASLAQQGLRFVGAGISGGEEGARHGPAIMPGGDPAAWPVVRPILTTIAAEADGEPCCDWIGPGGSGHYVKMVHNGIEYGDMQLIAEAYHLLRDGLGLDPDRMAEVFAEWNRGPLDSFLIELTAGILRTRDVDGAPLLKRVLDAAGQKGTGRWTVISSLELGQPVSLIGEAVYARALSALIDERRAAAPLLPGPEPALAEPPDGVVADLHDALYAAKIVSYAQGFMLLDAASDEYGWALDKGTVAAIWRNGCIIRSVFLGDITGAYRRRPDLPNLLLDDFFRSAVTAALPGWRRTVARAVTAGIPVPASSAALAFYDGYRRERLPANLIQAQRDAFGAHTFERIDRPRGEWFHATWDD